MSYRIKTHGPIASEICRVAGEEMAAALLELMSLDGDGLGDSIHAARKRLKKLRALVLLLREPLGAKQVRAEEACYRDIGRNFRRMRDAEALEATLVKLARRFFETRRPALVRAALRVLVREKHGAHRALNVGGELQTAIAALREARLRALHWRVEKFDWKQLAHALRRSYRRARHAWRQARADPKPRLLHKLRRRTNELFYQLSLCHSAAPKFLEELAGEFEVLGEFLGDDHDLIVLRETLSRHPRRVPPGKAGDAFFKILDLRREELVSAALDLAEGLFADPPHAFLRALEAHRQDHRRRRKKAHRMAARLLKV